MARSLLLAAAALVACVNPTQIVVLVQSDLDVPRQLDAIRIEVEGPGGIDERDPIRLTGDPPGRLPASFGVRPKDGDAGRNVTITVHGEKDGNEIVRTYARTSFVEHRRLRLDLFLARGCVDVWESCAESCGESGCEDAWRDPGDLPEWRDGDDAPVDGTPPDAGVDVPVDAGDGPGLDAGPSGCGTDVTPREWAVPGVEGGATTVTDLAAGDDGRVFVAGYGSGSVSLAGSPVELSDDGFVVCFDDRGCACWLKPILLDAGDEPVTKVRVAVAADGIFVAAAAAGPGLTLEGTPFEGSPVARFDAAGGYVSGIDVTSAGSWDPKAIAVDAGGEVAVAADATSSVSVGADGNPLTSIDLTTWQAAVLLLSDPQSWNTTLTKVEADTDVFSSDVVATSTDTFVVAGTAVGGMLRVDDTPASANPASSWVMEVSRAAGGARWQPPLVGGLTSDPEVSSWPALDGDSFFVVGLTEAFDLGGVALPLSAATQVGVARVPSGGTGSPVLSLLEGGDFLRDATSAGDRLLVVSQELMQFNLATYDESLVEVRDRDLLPGFVTFVAGSPDGRTGAALGVVDGAAVAGGHPIGDEGRRMMYVYSFDPNR